jgi:hypothetical protein
MPTARLGFTPISPNPFIVGNPVRDRSMFFGREAEFALVRKRFEHQMRGGLFVFCGERRSGKTSILFQIVDRRLGDAFIPVLIDMQSMAAGSEIEFLSKVAGEILNALGSAAGVARPPQFVAGTNPSASFLEFIRGVLAAMPGKKLILLFDEYELFENKIDAGTLDRDVLNVLASLMEHQSVFLIFTGSQHLEERRRDYWSILGKSIYRQISYLEHDDAIKLVREPVVGRVQYESGAVELIYRLAAGQPFYTQAICQNLVDQLNEREVNVATLEAVGSVVATLIDNPLPQMIFLWDGLERDEKLVLALLAETLEDDEAFATVAGIQQTVRRHDYPLDLSTARIATALEKLFKSEMALRSDETTPPGYAFRMDVWRLWIRRQHSVWQVIRELGLAIPHGKTARGRRWLLVGLAGTLAAVVGLWINSTRGSNNHPHPPAGTETFSVGVTPELAEISLDGQRIGIGSFRGPVTIGSDHRVEARAKGYADSALTVRVTAGDPGEAHLTLRPLLGDLRVETKPAGADVSVDGRRVGKSPAIVRSLRVAESHRVSATLAGFGVAEGNFAIDPGAVTMATLALAVGTGDLVLVTEPRGAEIRMDGAPRGTTPLTLTKVPYGRHVFVAQRDGFARVETTLVTSESVREIDVALPALPPGVLVVQGDRPASIYIDGNLIIENVQNSGPRELKPGEHQVRVVLLSNQTIDHTVEVRSRERVVFDFSSNSVTRPGGTP